MKAVKNALKREIKFIEELIENAEKGIAAHQRGIRYVEKQNGFLKESLVAEGKKEIEKVREKISEHQADIAKLEAHLQTLNAN